MAKYPLSVSSNGRFPQSPDGTPYPIKMDSTWYAEFNLDPTDQNTYFANRQSKGFTAILHTLIEHIGTLNKPPLDFNSVLPFTKRLDGGTYTGSPNGTTTANGNSGQYSADPYSNINNQSPDFTYPNSTYWNTFKTFVALCRTYNYVVFLFPAYVGFSGDDEGWMGEMVANDAVIGAGGQTGQSYADPSKSLLWNYGAYVANFFKSVDNIIWVMGGDYGSGGSSGTFTAPQKAAVNSLMAGMKSVAGQSSNLFTAHWSRPSLASDVTLSAGSFDLESVYADNSAAQYARSGYNNSPAAPCFCIENRYEGAAAGSPPYRQYIWWQVTSGGGYAFGNDTAPPIYLFQSGHWPGEMDSQTALDCTRISAFISGVAWPSLVPSGLNGMRTLITAGGGTASPQSTDYISAAATPDGTCIIAYVPPAHSGSFTVDVTGMGGAILVRWFDPTNAKYTSGGVISNGAAQAFTTPGTNSGGDNDWVLLLTRNIATQFLGTACL